MLDISAFARHLVQRTGQEAAAGQMPVDRRHTEAQHGSLCVRAAFQARDAAAQCV